MRGLYTIPAGTPFVDALASGILAAHGRDPLALSAVLVLLPTRRACRALREAFLRRSAGKPLLLPNLRPIGDVDADELTLSVADAEWEGAAANALDVPPAISPFHRRLLLSQLVLRSKPDLAPDQALFLAGELGRLLDQMQIEEVPFTALADIVPDHLAGHWQETLEFLAIISEHWPKLLAERALIDPAERRSRLLDAQAKLWQSQPPAHPVIAAGSTGTVPATARLLGVIANLELGCVVFPGLDTDLDAAAWDTLDPTHPQFAMRQLLQRVGAGRADVATWPGTAAVSPPRVRLLSEAMRPAGSWRPPQVEAAAVDGLHRIDCAGPEEEARAIALVLRQTLETPASVAALVTPDRALARRVAVEMTRWNVAVDDSAGTPLALTPVGAFLRHTALLVAENAAPIPLLAALKHPLAAGGMPPGKFRGRVRSLERLVLRGIRPAPGFAGLRSALVALTSSERAHEAKHAANLLPWLDGLSAAVAPVEAAVARTSADLADLMRAHVRFAEALAADGRHKTRLWSGDDGEAAALWVEETLRAAGFAPRFAGRHYAMVLAELMAGVVVRPAYPRHPRVHIWGPLEARMQQPDVLVLGGLNEGTWPPSVGAEPWLSRPMREDVGLPQLERRIGLAAHDFVQGAAAPMVVLTRSTKVGGEPTVPSRWLSRLAAVLDATNVKLPAAPWLAWQAELDEAGEAKPLDAPTPRPPVAVRPRKLSVSSVEQWLRDPYGVYAAKVLRLSALDPIDADPNAADRGAILHDAVDRFLRAVGDELPEDALAQILTAGSAAFGGALGRPGIRAFWWPLFRRVATWFVGHEREWRANARLAASEVKGELQLAGGFMLTAKADRVDRRNGGLVVIDYKTGGLPPPKEVQAGFAPQLALEGLIAEAGGFAGVPAAPVSEIAYWHLTGRDDGGKERAHDPALMPAARAGLLAYIVAFSDPAMPYRSRPRPEFGPRFSDYDHLARVMEWSSGRGEAEDDSWR